MPENTPRLLPVAGDRVRITGVMPEDPAPLAVGETGTVTEVHRSTQQIFVDWDSGRTLILLTTDPFEILGTAGLERRIDEIARLRARVTKHWLSPLSREENTLREQLDARRLDARPALPTDTQKAAIAKIAALVHAGTHDADPVSGIHLGVVVTEDDSVLYDPHTQRINVFAKAPYAASQQGFTRLWKITADEERALISLVNEQNLVITHRWRHDDGIAFIVAALTHPSAS